MELTSRLTVVARSLYKLLPFFTAILLFSCNSERDEVCFESEGFGFDDSKVQVSSLKLDSLQFAGGDILWVLEGTVQFESEVRQFNVKMARNPLKDKLLVISDYQKPPVEFKGKLIECVVTRNHNVFEITWRSSRKRIYLKSAVTSTR